jgi:hypothetical protein
MNPSHHGSNEQMFGAKQQVLTRAMTPALAALKLHRSKADCPAVMF